MRGSDRMDPVGLEPAQRIGRIIGNAGQQEGHHAQQAAAQAFADWVTSPAGQASIASYKVGGEPLFFPNAPR